MSLSESISRFRQLAETFRSALTEFGGIGGRVAGARKMVSLPMSPVVTFGGMTPELAEKRRREQEQRADVRDRLRQLSIEDRRPLKTLEN
jgi:hypothetical protein